MAIGKKRGWPTKLTAEVQAQIVADLELRHSFTHACEQANVPVKTAEEWLRRGGGSDRRKSSPEFAGFAAAVAWCKTSAWEAVLERARNACNPITNKTVSTTL